nr:immunoglobulin light chain junction region [Macaca mulatta]MOW44700.1 immunoglobulin light chain junction region [Macaca mulatta]
CQQSSDWPLTF